MQPQQATANRRFSATGFANEPKSFAPPYGERHVIDGANHVIAVVQREILEEMANNN